MNEKSYCFHDAEKKLIYRLGFLILCFTAISTAKNLPMSKSGGYGWGLHYTNVYEWLKVVSEWLMASVGAHAINSQSRSYVLK